MLQRPNIPSSSDEDSDQFNQQTLLPSERVIKQELVKEELRCRICLGILWEPKECKVCETCFCSHCLDQWLTTNGNNRCPLKCGDEPRFRDKPHKIIRNMLSELKFRCRNHSSGCLEDIDYQKVLEHEIECQFDMQACSGKSDGCASILFKRDIQAHELSCPLVPVECEYCHKKVKRSAIRAHWMACEEAELECEMCKGIFKKKNYPIHVNALCEENIMSCGRCSGTYKRKYKEYHDCVRHLQNCQKTMGEEIGQLKDKLNERDKRINELECRVFYEMAELRAQLMVRGTEENKFEHTRSTSSFREVAGKVMSPVNLSNVKWAVGTSKLVKVGNTAEFSEGTFDLKQAERKYKPQDMIFGYAVSQNSLVPISMTHMLELEINLQNITTSFIPMYYIIGVLNTIELPRLPLLNAFDSVYQLLSPTCTFLPSFGKSYSEKFRFCIRQRPFKQIGSSLDETGKDDLRFDIEDMEKQVKIKTMTFSDEQELHLFFGVYCSQNIHLINHKEIKVRIIQ